MKNTASRISKRLDALVDTIFDRSGESDYKSLCTERQLRNPELCDKYRKKLISLNEEIKTSDLDLITGSLFTSFYSMAIRELDGVVEGTNIKLNANKRERVMSLLNKGKDVKGETNLVSLFKQKTEEGYKVRVIKPGYPARRLLGELRNIGTCWIDKWKKLWPVDIDIRKKVSWHIKDINAGGCVLFIGESPATSGFGRYKPRVMARSYIIQNTKDMPVLYIDTIEGGHTGWCSISDWVGKGRGRELLYSIAAPIYVARHLGIEKVVLGEAEACEVGTKLGFKEEEHFKSNEGSESKISIKGDNEGNKGPYIYQLNYDSTRRFVDLNDLRSFSEEEILKRLSEIAIFLRDHPRTRKNKHKVEEIKFYLDCIESINEFGDINSKKVYYELFGIKEKYFGAQKA